MTNLIATDLRRQSVQSGMIDLFILELPNGSKVYFHPGVEADLTSVQFRDSDSPYAIRTYAPFPVEIEGLEIGSDGAIKRPTFSVANIGNNFTSVLEGFEIKDLIGQRLTRRQTLRKYLADVSTATPPVEMTSMTYVIDRISAETNTTITFETAVVYDLEGVTIPRRVSVGKFCAWTYQGHDAFSKGGCTWELDSSVTTHQSASNGDTTDLVHYLYFDLQDRPLITKTWADANISAYSNSTEYNLDSYVSTTDGSTTRYWLSLITGHTGNTPSDTSLFWKEAFLYQKHTFTDSTCDTISGDATVTHTANSSIVNGIFVSGAGIQEGSTVTSAASGTFELSATATATDTNIPLTFVTDRTYAVGDLVEATTTLNGNTLRTVWYCIKAHNSKTVGTIPSLTSKYWRREELCGKTLNSCKCRFQGSPRRTSNSSPYFNAAEQPPSGRKHTSLALPFGAFIGTEKL